MGWLSDYTYRKSLTLSRASGAITDYQMKILVGESSGASGENIDCNSHCLSTFDDIRFTTSDGETLLSYWIETITGTSPNKLATIWVKFDSIGTTDTTFYMYYGNTEASSYSNGTNTFITFDDFERGVDGDVVGGNWTVSVEYVNISTTQDIGNVTGYQGTRAVRFKGNNIGYARMYAPFSLSEDKAFSFHAYQTSGMFDIFCGNGTKGIYLYYNWGNVGWVDTSYHGLLSFQSQWFKVECKNINFTNGTYDIYINDILRKKSATMYISSSTASILSISASWSPNVLVYFDNIVLRNWRSVEPTLGAIGSEEEVILVPTITSFSPSSGFVGDEVTITGTGFGGTTSIKLYDEKVATVKSYTSTELTFYVPEDAENGCVYVSNDGIEWIISDTYFYVRQPVAITSVTPTICYIGDEVIIDGENFTGETTVTFYNGVSATIDSYTDTQIITHVPSGAISGNVTISDSGYSDTINISLYDLSITSFSPSSGHVGDEITITGTGFTNSVNVFFYDNIPATIDSYTETEITTHVPNLSETGIITVTHELLSDSSLSSFLVLNRYWVGDSGDWNDISHWSTSSGGPSGAEIPTSASNVTFDENSFTTDSQTVSLSGNCYCKTFDCSTISNLATFDFISSTYLNVYENITISPSASFTYPTMTNNDIIYKTFTFGIRIVRSCNIISNGVKFPPVTTSSSIILQDDITCENLLISGSLNSQGYKINSRGVTFQPLLSEIFIDINNSNISCYIFQIDDVNDKLQGNLLANIIIEEQT